MTEITISDEISRFMHDIIQKIIDEAGCRIPGSPQEAKGAEIIKSEMEKITDETEIEEFQLHPRAFLGWIRVDIVLVLASIGCFFLLNHLNFSLFPYILTGISFGLAILAFIIIWKEFFNYEEFVDPLFKEKTSQNVVGKINSSNKEPKKIILFGGHHDSALQFNLLRYLKYFYPVVLFLGMGIMFFWLLFSAAIFLMTLGTLPFGFTMQYDWFNPIVLIIGAAPLVALFFFVSSGEKANKVPGAVDNLSAVSVVLGLGNYLKEHPEVIPENTEIRLLSFGSEEAGLRGAYRYVERHLGELKKYEAELVNMDGIQSKKVIQIIQYEPTTRTRHSEEVVEKLKKASELVNVKVKIFGDGMLEKFIGQISGGTDTTAFSKAHIKASNLSSMELKKFVKFYHQPTDTPDMIDKGALENALKMCIAYLLVEKQEGKTD
ncbi:MAG: M28 family metallopeptidase [Promethearchaeia archaeon]